MKIQFYILLSFLLFLLACSDEGVSPVYGCMDEDASNYLEDANIDDDSCEYCFENPFGVMTGNDECDELDDGCDECGVCNEEYTYKFNDIYTMFDNLGCTGCHDSNSLNGGLDLTSYTSIMSSTTNSGGVISNCSDVESSVILQKIDGGSMAIYADEELIEAITIWISEGAPE